MATVAWAKCLARRDSINTLRLHPRALSTGRLQPDTSGAVSALASADWGRVGGRLRGAGARPAAELAVHFEQGREYYRAVHYCQQAAENALRRYAYREAITHLSKGLTLLQRLPDTPERLQQELAVQTTLGPALMATKGMAAPEVEQTYARARRSASRQVKRRSSSRSCLARGSFIWCGGSYTSHGSWESGMP